MAVDFELPPEFAAGVPEEFTEHRIMSTSVQMYFRSRCDEADEYLNTLVIALRKPEGQPGQRALFKHATLWLT
jgi:hypothetical protein